MTSPACVLIANEPRAYRDTIAVALRMLRPQTDVVVGEPERVDETVMSRAPEFVICSHLTTVVETRVPTWVVLDLEGSLVIIHHACGEQEMMKEIDLNGIVRLLDQAELSHPA